MTTLLPLGVTLAFALVLIAAHVGPGRAPVGVGALAMQAPRNLASLPATICRGKSGSSKVSEHVTVSAVLADPAEPDSALEIFDVHGKPLVTVLTSHVAVARGWIDGHVVMARGDGRREFGQAKPWFPTSEGWEVELITTSGTVYRCAGPVGASAREDLLRLHKRLLVGSVRAQAV